MKTCKKILALLLCIVLVLGSVQLLTVAEIGAQKVVSSLPFVTMSDLHIFPDSEQGSRGKAWMDFCRLEAKMFNESEAIIRTALTTACERAKESGAKYILMPGDLTKDSEYAAHTTLAEILRSFEAQYDVDFLVIDGNHDINTLQACTFQNDKEEPARAIKYWEFPEVYKDLGYDLLAESSDTLSAVYYPAIFDAATREQAPGVPGALSYVADLGEAYRLIAVDSCLYSFDEPVKEQTEGQITKEMMDWIDAWAKQSYADGRTPFLMIHHSLAPHMETEPSVTFAFVLNDYQDAAEHLAAEGIHYAFTGHLHINDTAAVVNDDGDVLYDVQTDSVTGYPNTYRENKLETMQNGQTRLTTNAVNFDAVEKMTFDGVTYDNNTYGYHAFALCFGGGISKSGYADAGAFMMGLVKGFGGRFVTDIQQAGGLSPYLAGMGLDLRALLEQYIGKYIGNGIVVAGHKIFTMDNIMWFIEDLLDQVSKLYIEDPEHLYEVLEPIVYKLADFEVSELPCTEFIETLGFGDPNKPGTLGDAVLSAMYYWFNGNENTADDAFMRDVIEQFDTGDTFHRFFDFFLDLALHDIVEDLLLNQLEIRAGKLLNNTFLMQRLGDGINYLLKVLLRGDLSYGNLVKIVFALGILPYSSLYDVLDQLLLSKYLTPSMLEGLGQFVAFVLNDFTTDSNPIFLGDSEVNYTSEKVEPEATRKNYRIPTMVNVTLGEDPQHEATISWYSKSTLEGDIEIYRRDEMPRFTGKPTKETDFTIECFSETVERQFPGIDLDISGVLWYLFKLNRHTVKLSGLEPNAKYYYRVGNAEHGWWSSVGCVKTADGSANVTFLHTCDPQSQNDRQYTRSWSAVLNAAFEAYPQTDFVINTGDLVDHGNNNKQWQAMFDTASNRLMNTYLMPASGNHEGFGNFATVNYFRLPNVPEQDTESGVYYSFDYNNVHFAVLNTEDLGEDNALTQTQINWLRADMNASSAPWKFVMLHKAPYSQGSHYNGKDVIAIRAQLGALMPELGVDMVFEGHDHVYMRTASLINNEKAPTTYSYLEQDGTIYKTQDQPTGTTYVISGTAGVKTYQANDTSKTDEYFPRADAVLSLDTPMFTAVEIKDQVLYLNAYTVKDGETIREDNFAIRKDKTQGNQIEYTEEVQQEENESKFIAFMKTFAEYITKIFKVIVNLFKIYVLQIKL